MSDPNRVSDPDRGGDLRLDGLHHVTMLTASATSTIAFYSEVLGLRLIKVSVNLDRPPAYHLYFGDEVGSPGSCSAGSNSPSFSPAVRARA